MIHWLSPLLLHLVFLLTLPRCTATLFYDWSVCESNRLFLYDFQLLDGGCRITCLYLSSSSNDVDDGKDPYFDYSFSKEFDLEESEECIRSKSSQICVQIVTAAFTTPHNKPQSFKIAIGDKTYIANGSLTGDQKADYKQEFCFPTNDMSADHVIKITPLPLEDTRPHVASAPGSRFTPTFDAAKPDDHSEQPEKDDADDYNEDDDDDKATTISSLTDAPEEGREEFASIPVHVFSGNRGSFAPRPEDKPIVPDDVSVEISSDGIGRPTKRPFSPRTGVSIAAFAPTTTRPHHKKPILTLHTKVLLDRNENATVTTHNVGEAKLDIKVTFRQKRSDKQRDKSSK